MHFLVIYYELVVNEKNLELASLINRKQQSEEYMRKEDTPVFFKLHTD
jgi:hypothetical protein